MSIDLVVLNVDPELLAEQQKWLLEIQDRDCAGGTPSWDAIEGAINLIGAMLDQCLERETK